MTAVGCEAGAGLVSCTARSGNVVINIFKENI